MKNVVACILDFIFPPRDTEVTVRELVKHNRNVPYELVEQAGTPRITSLASYHDTQTRACILEAKFHANTQATQLLANTLSDYLISYLEDEHAFDTDSLTIIPIPLSRKRFRERGYNQTERIVSTAVRTVGEPMRIDITLVHRLRDTLPQTSLDRVARRTNMDGAFSVKKQLMKDHTYIVVDDVTTTGATLRAAHSALRKAGASHIVLIALAH